MSGRRVVVVGAGGQLGGELVDAYGAAGNDVLALSRRDVDIARPAGLEKITQWRPDVVVNAAAWTDVDGCARNPELARSINGLGAGHVARASAAAGAMIMHISTNEVFDGTSERAYSEDDSPNPINAYGVSKLAGEAAVRAANERHLIVRTAWLYGRGGRNFPGKIRQAAERMRTEGIPLRVVADEWGNPTDVRWLAPALAHLMELNFAGEAQGSIYHVAGEPAASRFEWAQAILRGVQVTIETMALEDYHRESRVPARAVLDMTRARSLGIPPGYWDVVTDSGTSSA